MVIHFSVTKIYENVLWPMYSIHILWDISGFIVVINVLFVKVLLQMLLLERCMREVYLFTHVDEASQWPLLVCWLLPGKSATVQCSCFALLCNPHNAVLCALGCWVRLAWRDTERVKEKQSGCLGIWPFFNRTLIWIPNQWTIESCAMKINVKVIRLHSLQVRCRL